MWRAARIADPHSHGVAVFQEMRLGFSAFSKCIYLFF